MMKSTQNLEQKRFFFIILFFSFIYIIFSSTYFSFEETLISGARDGITYLEISKNFPYFKENNFAASHNQRFIVPYIIGFLGYLSDLDLFMIYRIGVFILFFFIFLQISKALKYLKIENFDTTVVFLFIILNPYLIRYYISLPTLINDLIFILGSIILINGFLKKKPYIIYLGLFFSIISRQTGIFFLLSLIICKVIFKKKFFLKNRDIFFSTLLIFIVICLNNFHANIASDKNFFSSHSRDFYGIYFFFKDNFEIKRLIEFLLFPLLNWSPLILLYIVRKGKFSRIEPIDFFIIVSTILIFIQPLLAGPDAAGKNLIRLSNLSYLMILIFIVKNSFFKKLKLKFIYHIFYIFLIIWSMHPTYSKIKIFNFAKNFIF